MTKFKPSPEQVETRAYAIFLARGSEDGHAEEDWLAAERELELEQDLARDSGTAQSISAAAEEPLKARAATASQRPTTSASSASARDVSAK
jgi:hypothetical protein